MIKQEDLPVLRHLFNLLKDIKNNDGITFDHLPKEILDRYTERNKNATRIRIEFERLSDFFILTELASLDERKYGLYLVPKNKIYESDINKIYKEFKKSEKRKGNKVKIEDLEYPMSKLKYYSNWILLGCTIISTYIAVKNYNENKTNQESIIQLELNLKEKDSELSKFRTLNLYHKNQDSSFQTNSDKETLKESKLNQNK